MKQFIDSTVIVGAFTPNNNKESCQQILRQGGIINLLVLVESFDVIQRITKNKLHALRSIKSMITGNFNIIDIDKGLFFDSLRKIGNLRIFDAVHYATASITGCEAIISYDHDFDNLEIKRIEP